jgi:hypothetical protein
MHFAKEYHFGKTTIRHFIEFLSIKKKFPEQLGIGISKKTV